MEYYKYLNDQRLDVLEDLTMRYTQALVFNDPFEAFPAIVDENMDWYHQQFIELIESDIKSRVFKSQLEKQAVFDACMKGFPEFYEFSADRNRQLDHAFSVVMSDALTKGYLSLSKTNRNILMWSHYAQNHQGFIIGFDAKHEYFNSGVSEIIYSDKRPSLNPFQKEQAESVFLTKSTDWAYEQEVRKSMAFTGKEPLDSLPKSTDEVYESVKLFKYPKSAISSVIFGWKSTPELRKNVLGILDSHGLSSVKVMAAVPHPSEYKMTINNI